MANKTVSFPEDQFNTLCNMLQLMVVAGLRFDAIGSAIPTEDQVTDIWRTLTRAALGHRPIALQENNPNPSWWNVECAVCKQLARSNNNRYMVHDAVWRASGLESKDYAHIQCLEKQVGRELVLVDFPDLPINNVIRWALDKNKAP